MNKMKQKLKRIKKKLSLKRVIFKKKYVSLSRKDNEILIESKSILQPVKIRNSGVDLGRILAMLGIIIHHVLLHGQGFNKYRKYPDLKKLNTAVFWHVSTYIFISGYVGYKTTKYSNLLYLWLCTLFYSIGIVKYLTLYKPYIYKREIGLMDFFPVFTNQYWFFILLFGF